jgi:mRNA interferase RelE/StbE
LTSGASSGSYRVVFTDSFLQGFRSVPKPFARLIERKLTELESDPRPGWSKRLTGYRPPAWRFRVGGWRVIYEVDDAARAVTVLRVARRDQVYDRQ